MTKGVVPIHCAKCGKWLVDTLATAVVLSKCCKRWSKWKGEAA